MFNVHLLGQMPPSHSQTMIDKIFFFHFFSSLYLLGSLVTPFPS